MTSAKSISLKPIFLAIAVVVVLVLVAAPEPAFASKGKIIGMFPDTNTSAPAAHAGPTVVLIEVEDSRAPYVFVTFEPFNLEVGDQVVFETGPGRTATSVAKDGDGTGDV